MHFLRFSILHEERRKRWLSSRGTKKSSKKNWTKNEINLGPEILVLRPLEYFFFHYSSNHGQSMWHLSATEHFIRSLNLNLNEWWKSSFKWRKSSILITISWKNTFILTAQFFDFFACFLREEFFSTVHISSRNSFSP